MSRRLWRPRIVAANRHEWLVFVVHAVTGEEVRIRGRAATSSTPRCDACGPNETCDHARAARRAYLKTLNPTGAPTP